MDFDFGIIGGGLVGLGTAYKLNLLAPRARVVLWEKESLPGQHQSTHNSGVLHAGLYYKPGSLKARLAVAGIREMAAFCREHGIAHEICGKLVVATDDQEVGRLKTLLERGTQNGLTGLKWIPKEGIRDIEPHAAGVAAVRVPEEGIVDYAGVVSCLSKLLQTSGVAIRTNSEVHRLTATREGWQVEAGRQDHRCRFIVNCAGLHSDRMASLAGERRQVRIVPFRGEYYQIRPERASLVRNLIYPVPDPSFPFLGVHYTRLIHGGIEAGPNAVLALAREGYTKAAIHPGDLFDALSFPGLWRFASKHWSMCVDETRRSFSRKRFCQSLQRLVPEITESDLIPGGAGVRAQAMTASGELVQDFDFIERPHALHVINAPSPGATASLAIGETVARKTLAIAGIEAERGVGNPSLLS